LPLQQNVSTPKSRDNDTLTPRTSKMTVFTIKTGRSAFRRLAQRRNPFTSPTAGRRNHGQPDRSQPQPTIDDSTISRTIPIPNTISPLPLWQRLGPLTVAFRAYGRSQRNRPYTTQVCSSIVIYFLGDFGAQSMADNDYDPMRALRSVIIGAISSIPSYRW